MDRGGPLSNEQQAEILDSQAGRSSVRDLREMAVTDSYLKQMPRRWRYGDVYGPRDLSAREMKQWRLPKKPKKDILDLLGFNPLDNYKVSPLLTTHITITIPPVEQI